MASPTLQDGSQSPQQQNVKPKNVTFELLFPESPHYRARLPMRVQIYPHDTTDSIITTVKNFYGLYSGPTGSKGVSFEDESNTTLIARYENFRNNMVVYVRVIDEPPSSSSSSTHTSLYNGEHAAGMASSHLQNGQETSRSDSRNSHKRSPSPNGRGNRSTSTSTAGKKGRPRSTKLTGGANGNGYDGYSDSHDYSSGNDCSGSASGRAKEQIGNTEISLDNIVEGGRRKRAKFESSELPLFAPPQMPASTSNPSVSPARRLDHTHTRPNSLPVVPHGHNPFTGVHPLMSPQAYHMNGNGHNSNMFTTPAPDSRRSRNSIGYGSIGASGGVLPTPDPTVGSCMSEEDKDVAIQLMRLGDMSNISHGRTSASTMDDTFSGRADATSSTGATSDTSDDENELPPARRQKLETQSTSRRIYPTTETLACAHDTGNLCDAPAHTTTGTTTTNNSNNILAKIHDTGVGIGADRATGFADPVKPVRKPLPKPSILPPPATATAARGGNKTTAKKIAKAKKVEPNLLSLHATFGQEGSSLASLLTVANGEAGEDPNRDLRDLSSKPRCQRCRKSKKGCDRQRPCGRCRDAGLTADECISEDEGNGRKGRFGRHMGVPLLVTKDPSLPGSVTTTLLPAAPIQNTASATSSSISNKKRKR